MTKPSEMHTKLGKDFRNDSRSYLLHANLYLLKPGLARSLEIEREWAALRTSPERRCRVVREGILRVCGSKHGFNLTYYERLPEGIKPTR